MEICAKTVGVPAVQLVRHFVHGAVMLWFIEQVPDTDFVFMGPHGQSVTEELLLVRPTKHALTHAGNVFVAGQND